MQWAAETSPFANERYDIIGPPMPTSNSPPAVLWR
jgi:hypothetical protein